MKDHPATGSAPAMRLYDRAAKRLYINAEERVRFLHATAQEEPHIRAFCLLLLYSGCRLSEARALRLGDVQAEPGLISIRSLKKRGRVVVREIPIPQKLLRLLLAHGDCLGRENNFDAFLWSRNGRPVDRATAYRWVKRVMQEARISGLQACPKGLRHGYGIQAIRTGVQLHMLQKWMGHADMTTTAIYASAVGRDELEIAALMWASD